MKKKPIHKPYTGAKAYTLDRVVLDRLIGFSTFLETFKNKSESIEAYLEYVSVNKLLSDFSKLILIGNIRNIKCYAPKVLKKKRLEKFHAKAVALTLEMFYRAAYEDDVKSIQKLFDESIVKIPKEYITPAIYELYKEWLRQAIDEHQLYGASGFEIVEKHYV